MIGEGEGERGSFRSDEVRLLELKKGWSFLVELVDVVEDGLVVCGVGAGSRAKWSREPLKLGGCGEVSWSLVGSSAVGEAIGVTLNRYDSTRDIVVSSRLKG